MENQDTSKYTIKSVAELAGVSVSTVSRVMNNPESVTLRKRNRVLKVIKDVNYKPSPIARALSYDRIGSVGIVVPNIVNQTSASIVYGAADFLEKNGLSVILYDAREDLEREMVFYKSMPQRLIEGAMIIYGNGSEDTYKVLAGHIPLVLLGGAMSGLDISQITVNDQLGILNLVQHLFDTGHRDIGFIGGSLKTQSGGRRAGLFRDTMNQFGLTVQDSFIKNVPWTMEGGYAASLELCSSVDQLPSAFICSSDQIAIGAIRGFIDSGISVPDNLSVTGFDNSPMSRFTQPSLTTLNYPHTSLGQMAAEALVQRISNPESPYIRKILPLEVVPGESTSSKR